MPYGVAASLIEGLRSEVVVQNDHARQLFPDINPAPFKAAVAKAVEDVENSYNFV